MRLIDPVKEIIGIRGLKKRENVKVCNEITSVEDVKKFMENDGLKQAGIQVANSALLNPRLIVFDVPKDLDTPRLIEVVFSQNENLLAAVAEEEFRNGFLLRFKTGKKDSDLVNWVVETSPKIRNILRGNGSERIYLCWQSCKIQDYRGISRCFKCLRFGHISKFCKSENSVCSYCSEEGHEHKKCLSWEGKASPVCCNCKIAGRPSVHEEVDSNCPAYKLALERLIARTYYGVQ